MEAKLVKTKTGFYLWKNPLDKSQKILGATVPIMNDNGVDLREYNLSLKNCEAIANGYDLDELACDGADEIQERWHVGEEWSAANKGFKKGFQKALEILGDKKFSEEDVLNLIKRSREKTPYNFDGKSTEYKFSEDELIQSLQTEWDVEIVQIRQRCHLSLRDWIDEDENGEFPMSIAGAFSYRRIPKLDADECLILKRKI